MPLAKFYISRPLAKLYIWQFRRRVTAKVAENKGKKVRDKKLLRRAAHANRARSVYSVDADGTGVPVRPGACLPACTPVPVHASGVHSGARCMPVHASGVHRGAQCRAFGPDWALHSSAGVHCVHPGSSVAVCDGRGRWSCSAHVYYRRVRVGRHRIRLCDSPDSEVYVAVVRNYFIL